MKKWFKQFVGTMICFALAATVLACVKPVQAADSTVPTQEGKLFAGYYKDEACTIPVLEDDGYAGTKYAKFADEAVLGVKAQLKRGVNKDSANTDMRLVTSIESLDLREVTFDVNFNGVVKSYTTSTAYTRILAYEDGQEEPITYEPQTTFAESSQYFVLYTLKGIPNGAWDGNFSVTAKWKTKDGTIVAGSTKDFAINDQFYEAKFVDANEVVHKGTLKELMTDVNANTEDVTIQLTQDCTLNATTTHFITFNNANGKNIAIEGNGHTITATGSQEVFYVKQPNGTVVFRNATIQHDGTGSLLMAGDYDDKKNTGDLQVNWEGMNINVTKHSADYSSVIGSAAEAGKVTMDFRGVDINVTKAVGTNGAGVVGVRNAGNNKNFELHMTDCNINSAESTNRRGIYVIGKWGSGSIHLANTNIATKGAIAVGNGTGRIPCAYDENCTFTKDGAESGAVSLDVKAKVGDTTYNTFTDAFNAVKDNGGTISLRTSISLGSTKTFNSENNPEITIEGNGCYLFTSGSSTIFEMKQKSGSLTFKGVNIYHTGSNILLRSNVTSDEEDRQLIRLEDCDIRSNGTGVQYYLIGSYGKGGTKDLELVNTNITMKSSTAGNSGAIIRTGNSGASDAKTTNITLDGCILDATEAAGRSGVRMMDTTDGHITLKDTKIYTQNDYAVRYDAMVDTLEADDDCVFDCTSSAYHKALPIRYPKQAQITTGTQNGVEISAPVQYGTIRDALDAAKTSFAGDVTIELLSDGVLDLNYSNEYIGDFSINPDSDRNIIIDGKGFTLKTAGTVAESGAGGSTINFNGTTGFVTIKDVTIDHGSACTLFRTNYTGAAEGATTTVNLKNVTINAHNEETYAYKYSLINIFTQKAVSELNMDNVVINETLASGNNGSEPAVIRTGNWGQAKTVCITMKDSTINATQANKRAGIMTNNGTTLNLTLENSAINTMNYRVIYAYGGSTINLTKDTETTWSRGDQEEAPLWEGTGTVNEQ